MVRGGDWLSLRQAIEFASKQFRGIPFYKLLPGSLLKNLFKQIRLSGLKASPLDYSSFCLFSSLTLFFLVLFISSLNFAFLESLAASALFSAIALIILVNYPSSLAREKTLELERDLATGLKTIHLALASGNSFEKALQLAARGHGTLSQELSVCLQEIRGGVPVAHSLQRFSEFDSLLVKRCASQLAFEYEHGGRGEGLSAIADELLSIQQARAREFASRLSFYTVLFVGASAVFPALFSAYLIIAGSFLEIAFSQEQILFAFTLFFPLVDLAILYYLKSTSPKLVLSRS